MKTTNKNIVFTLFTSTYNRSDTISRVWNSLNRQTYRNFEWIVIDNLSSDNIKEILDGYQKEATFPMTVIYNEENMGKHLAFNKAVDLAKGQFFIPADADDEFIPESLEIFINAWNEIPEEKRANVSGVNVICLDPETRTVAGKPYPFSPFFSNNMELLYKYHIYDEKWGMIRTDLLRKYRFPEIRSRIGHFIDNYIWFSFARDGYQAYCINEPLRLYYTNTNNSVSRMAAKNPTKPSDIKYFYLKWNLNTNLNYIVKLGGIMPVLRDIINVTRFGLVEGKRISDIIRESSDWRVKFLLILFTPFTYPLYYLTYYRMKE